MSHIQQTRCYIQRYSMEFLPRFSCFYWSFLCHDDFIKWKHFTCYWPIVWGIHWSLVNSPHKGQWRGALMFSLICTWINAGVNNREAGDLRRHSAHYDDIGMAEDEIFCRDLSVDVPSQWETTLHCNVISYWLGAYTKWSLTPAELGQWRGCWCLGHLHCQFISSYDIGHVEL